MAIFPDSEFLIDRAEKCRALASTFHDPILRDRMLEIASGYEELAKGAETLAPLESIKVSELKSPPPEGAPSGPKWRNQGKRDARR